MAQKKSIPARIAKDYQLVPVDDLTGGVDLRRTPSLLPANRARTLRNFSLAEQGALRVDYGYQSFSSGVSTGGRAEGGQRGYLCRDVFTLMAENGFVYKVDDSGSTWSTAVYSTISPTNQVHFPHDRDIVLVLDGVNRPRKSDNDDIGSSWTLAGIDSPSSAATVSSLSAGTFISGSEYEFTYAYVDDKTGHISNESSARSTYTMGSTGGVSVVVSNSTDPQVDTVYIYARNKTAGDSVRRRAGSVAQSTSSSNSTVSITSTAWTANAEAPTNHDVPLAFAFGVFWKNRFWARHPTIKNRLHFSELFQPQSFPALYYVDIPFERGDEIKAMVPQGDTLVIFGGTKPYLIIGQTSLDFEVKPSLGEAGAFGPRAAVAVEYGVLHANYQGVHIFDGATDRLLSFDIDPAWRDLVSQTSAANLALVAMVYHELRHEVRIAVPRLFPTAAAGEWILDLNRTRLTGDAAWTSTDRTIGGYIIWNGNEATAGNQGRLFSWHSSLALVSEESTGTSANGSNLVSVYEGPTLTTGRHMARWIDTRVEFRPSGGTLTAELKVDGLTQGSQAIDIGSGLTPYDSTAGYDDAGSNYDGSDRLYRHLNWPLSANGYAATMTLNYAGKDAHRFYTYAHGIRPETNPRNL